MSDAEPTVEPHDLFAHARFVRELAMALMRELDAAEDLAQDAWLVAIERPPRSDLNVKAWFWGVLRNLARNRRRADRRRVAHEIASTIIREAPASDADAARLEQAQRLMAAVQRLSPHHRRVVLLRFFDELPPREIALRTGQPAATVKTQLHRALRQLREDLTQGGDVRSLVVGLALLVPRTTPALAGLAGGILVTTKAKLALVSVVLALTGVMTWRIWQSGSPRSMATTTTPSAAIAGRGDVTDQTKDEQRTTRDELVVDATRSKASRSAQWIVRGRLVGLDPRVPWQTPILLQGQQKSFDHGALTYRGNEHFAAQDMIEADGAFEIAFDDWMAASPPARRAELIANDPRYIATTTVLHLPHPAAGEAPEPVILRCDVTVAACARISGRVVDEQGDPVAGSLVRLFPHDATQLWSGGVGESTTDAEGRFLVRTTQAGELWLVASSNSRDPSPAAQPTLVPNRVAITAAIGTETRTPDLVLTRGATISGHVRFAGRPMAGVMIKAMLARAPGRGRDERDMRSAGPEGNADRWIGAAGESLQNEAVLASTQADGSYVLEGLARATYEIAIDEQGSTIVMEDVATGSKRRVAAPATHVDFELATSIVTVEVLADDGTPLPLAQMWLHCTDHTYNLTGGEQVSKRSLIVKPGLTLTIGASSEGYLAAESTVTLPPDPIERRERIALARDARPPQLVVTMHDGDGRAIEHARYLTRQGGREVLASGTVLVAEAGAFSLRDLALGIQQLSFRPDGDVCTVDSFFQPIAVEVEIRDGIVERRDLLAELGGRLRISVNDRAGKFLAPRCRVRDARGADIAVSFLTIREGADGRIQSWGTNASQLAAKPTEVDPPLAPGRYDIELSLPGYFQRTVSVEVAIGRTTEIEVEMAKD